jgi:two-component system chemotaxis response regulator CheY
VHDVNFLIVDDSPTIITLVRKVLENKLGSHNIHVASDGHQAIEILKSTKIDFILSDWEMPNMSGDELLYEVRHNNDWKLLPFVMMTTHGGKDFIMTAVQNGVTHYLVKPFTAVEMEDRIRKSWNAASKRNNDRFSNLPAHNLLIKDSSKSYSAKLLDLSATGCLIRMEHNSAINLFNRYEMSVEFESIKGDKSYTVTPIPCMITRLERDAGDMQASVSRRLCQVAVYFDPKAMDRTVEKRLNDLVKWLATLSPDTIIDNK